MATMIVKHRVANWESWKKVFDSMQETRAQHGWIGHEVHRDAADPNLVVIVNHMRDLDGAKRYGSSPALREAMQRAGVQSAPEITFLDDAEKKTY
jgi:quinol monooxygenase YgiN